MQKQQVGTEDDVACLIFFHLTWHSTRTKFFSVNWLEIWYFSAQSFSCVIRFYEFAGVDEKEIFKRSIKCGTKLWEVNKERKLIDLEGFVTWWSVWRDFQENSLIELNYESICVIKWTDSRLIMFQRPPLHHFHLVDNWANSPRLSVISH